MASKKGDKDKMSEDIKRQVKEGFDDSSDDGTITYACTGTKFHCGDYTCVDTHSCSCDYKYGSDAR